MLNKHGSHSCSADVIKGIEQRYPRIPDPAIKDSVLFFALPWSATMPDIRHGSNLRFPSAPRAGLGEPSDWRETQEEDNMTTIFVFGSNLAGRHGKGAARYARQHHGAIYGQAGGLQGSSYAIPTKDAQIKTLPLGHIQQYVQDFKTFAASRTDLTFHVTPIGCGLAGYTPDQIAPMFKGAPVNCILPDAFIPYL